MGQELDRGDLAAGGSGYSWASVGPIGDDGFDPREEPSQGAKHALGTVRQVSRNVTRWRNAEMALRRTAAGMPEAQKNFRRLKAYRRLPLLRSALQDHMRKAQANSAIETIMNAA